MEKLLTILLVAGVGCFALAWVLGGPLNEFEMADGGQMPRHSHLSEVWTDGMLVFDNRNHDAEQVSRVVRYDIDAEARTVREAWSFQHPRELFVPFLGDARTLPGGNVLVAWSNNGALSEITPDGEIVWEVQTDQRIGRIEFVPDWPG